MEELGFRELWERLLEADESVLIEAKRATAAGPSLLATVCAFANEPGRGGGYILLGVAVAEDALFPEFRYEIVGVPDPDTLQAELATQCGGVFNTPIRPQMTLTQVAGKTVVVMHVPEAQPHEKPVYFKRKGLPKGAFRRIGSTDQHCTDEDIAFFYQLRDHRTYDETPVAGTGPGDVDPDALKEYRRARARINPSAPELSYDDRDLLFALAATDARGSAACVTIGGLLVFGMQASLRRHFPMARVDYIRVPGREWVPDPENRYQAVELRGPLLTLVPRVVAHVLDDIPKAFSLTGEDIYRKDVPSIPRMVVREAIVNAVMHRTYRLRQPVQIIRYANRIEIRNPGHSLVPDERLGEPGSLTRNEKIAAILHEVGLAETKGTGVRAMREALARANLTLPLFESDREKDAFVVTLLVHHLLGPEDVEWLTGFRDCGLSEDEARALIVVREVGAINNAAYRDINHVDSLTASSHLRRMRDLSLLTQRPKGAATYYVEGKRLTKAARDLQAVVQTDTEPLRAESAGLRAESEPLRAELPADMRADLDQLPRRSTPEQLDGILIRLCRWRPLSLVELGALTRKSTNHLRSRNIKRLLANGQIQYTHPDEPNRPDQKYKAPDV